eukprot:12672878-Prorocentrum_lima.AAC.1
MVELAKKGALDVPEPRKLLAVNPIATGIAASMAGEEPVGASGIAVSAAGSLTDYLQHKPIEKIGGDGHDYL